MAKFNKLIPLTLFVFAVGIDGQDFGGDTISIEALNIDFSHESNERLADQRYGLGLFGGPGAIPGGSYGGYSYLTGNGFAGGAIPAYAPAAYSPYYPAFYPPYGFNSSGYLGYNGTGLFFNGFYGFNTTTTTTTAATTTTTTTTTPRYGNIYAFFFRGQNATDHVTDDLSSEIAFG